MGNCYSINHIADDYRHTDIACNIEDHNKNIALERSVKDYKGGGGVGGGGGLKHVLLDSNFTLCFRCSSTQLNKY